MSPTMKFLLGLLAVVAMTWVQHGPLGRGAALIDQLEQQAKADVAKAAVPGVAVTLDHAPLARVATLSGPADNFQRYGQGEMPGLTQIVGGIEGISAVRWADDPHKRAFVLPLLAESIGLTLAAFLIGVAFAWLLWGRREPERYY
jgi:hypothetical protein